MKKYLLFILLIAPFLCGCKSKEEKLKEIAVQKSLVNIPQRFEIHEVLMEDFTNPLLFDIQSKENAIKIITLLQKGDSLVDNAKLMVTQMKELDEKNLLNNANYHALKNQMDEGRNQLEQVSDEIDYLIENINTKGKALGDKLYGQKITVVLYDKNASKEDDSILKYYYVFDENNNLIFDSLNDINYKSASGKHYSMFNILENGSVDY